MLDWAGRLSYLAARAEKQQIETYGMDLVWLIAKRWYPDIPQPSEIAVKRRKTDRRNARQITDDVLKKLRR